MKKTKPIKNTISLLMLLLLNTLVLANLPITVTANPTTIEVVSIYTEPEERAHWDVLKAAFESEYPDIDLVLSPVEMDDMFDEVIERHLLGTDADVIFMHTMWLPTFAYDDPDPLVTPIVAPAPPGVALDVETNFVAAAKEAVKYKGVVYGIPTEFNSHALVYNHKIIKDKIDLLPTGDDKTFLEVVLTKLNVTKVPLTYSELKRAARLLTVWKGGTIYSPGFMPYIDGNEEKRYEFMNLLWSNNGEFLDLTGDPAIGTMPKRLPEALFNSPAGLDVLMLFNDLSTKTSADPSYNPDILPDIYWTAWYEERVAMVVIPGWFTYIRSAMGDRFSHVGVAPVPIGPQPDATTTSVTYAWMMAVTQRAAKEGRADAAWTFLNWLNIERKTVYIDAPLPIGPIPKGTPCSIMGDWLITDSTMPARINDQLYGKVSVGGVPTNLMREDHWFKGFMDQAFDYGRADKAFLKSEEVQDKVGFMFETVASLGAAPAGTLATAAAEVNDILPIPGDINMDGKVGVADAQLLILDYGATPAAPAIWNRGRSDINEDNYVDIEDATIIVVNWT